MQNQEAPIKPTMTIKSKVKARPKGKFKVNQLPAEKKDGLVTALSLEGKRYRFQYAAGLVEKVAVEEAGPAEAR